MRNNELAGLLRRAGTLHGGQAGACPYGFVAAVVLLAAIVGSFSPAGATDFLNQHRVWKHTTTSLNDTYLKAAYVDTNHPDTSFNHDNDSDFFLYASGDGGTWWNQAIMIDFGWDSIYGWGPTKIPNPGQADSCTIDSGWLWVQIPSWDYSDIVNIAAYRVYSDFDYDGAGSQYPSWNHPKSGKNWASGATFSRSDLYGEDSSTVTVNTVNYIRLPVAGIFGDFTDSTGRRTGIGIGVKFAHPDHDSTACFYTESHAVGNSCLYLELWWSEYGVQSTIADSQKVMVRDAAINAYYDIELEVDYSHYNYGAATTLQAGTNYATAVENSRILIDHFGLTDSLDDNLEIDSARCYFYIDATSGLSLTVFCYKTVRWWGEGNGVGGAAACGADYWHSQHGTSGECATSYGWGIVGCGGATDRESAAFDTVAADTGWNYFWAPDSMATGMYNDRDKGNASRTNHTGVLVKMAAESTHRIHVRSQNYPGTNDDPFWVFYFHQEVAATATRRPAAIDEIVYRGAYLK